VSNDPPQFGATISPPVIAGLDPAIHDGFHHAMEVVRYSVWDVIMDARVKPAHDAEILVRLV
jgi:hypothetical protein